MVTSYILGVVFVVASIIGLGYLGYRIDDEDGAIVGVEIAVAVDLVISFFTCEVAKNFSSGCIVTVAVLFIGALLGLGLAIVMERIRWCDWLDYLGALVIIMLMVAGLVIGGVHVHRQENIVLLDEPEVVTTQYELLGGGDSARVSGSFYRIRGEVGTSDAYKVYVMGEKNGENIAVPMVLPENSTTVILMEDGFKAHLVKTEKVFYKEDRNVTPYEKSVDHVETSYKLYVEETVFNSVQFDGN